MARRRICKLKKFILKLNVREILFFLFDHYFNKGIVKSHLDDIGKHYHYFHDVKNIQQRDERLSQLLAYVIKNVNFYSGIDKPELLKFPVVNKAVIKENYNDFISKEFSIGELSYVTTSGSTGTPFKSYRDQNKVQRHIADNIFFNQLVGGDIGIRLYYFRVWNSINRKGFLKKIIQNIEEIDANDFTKEYIESLLQKMSNDSKEKYMLSYASSYEVLCQSILQNNLKLNFKNVSCMISMSETLPEGVRSFLEDYFKTNLVSRYSNMENGFIGQQCLDEKNEYHINTASFKVEVLKIDEDITATEGDLGRIVITDLFNFGMPMIRYDTGDLGVLSYSKCKINGPVLSRVDGRKTDFIYDTNGKMLSPHIITNTMWKYSEINQFQFIQKTRVNYLLILNSKSPISNDIIISEFRQFLGQDAIVSIEYVDEIPLLASGKRKKVVNEYKPT